jgi:hypothetical protein
VDGFVLRIFQQEVALQCKFALSAAKELEAAFVLRSTEEIWRGMSEPVSKKRLCLAKASSPVRAGRSVWPKSPPDVCDADVSLRA